MGLIKKKRCSNCNLLFKPDHRNRSRQKYCDKPECRKVSKKVSQKKWLSKPENKDYFKGSQNVERVQDWRNKNPGYWNRPKSSNALQDSLTAQHSENIADNGSSAESALQDFLMQQPPVIVGLIANLTGTALQDNIALTLLRMQKFGQDILSSHFQLEGDKNDCKEADFRNQDSKSPPKFQLDRSPTDKRPAH